MGKLEVQGMILDLDNTLYDEHQYFYLAFKQISHRLASICNMEERKLYDFLSNEFAQKGSQYPKFFKYILEKLDIYSSELDQQILEIYKTVTGYMVPYPDALQALTSLKGRVKLALVTNGIVQAQVNKVRLLGIQPHFDYICYARELGTENEKPNSAPFLKVLEVLKIEPDHLVSLGDNPKTDIEGTKKLGIYTVLIRRGEMSHVPFPSNYKPDLEIFNFNDLWACLESRKFRLGRTP